jgi:hypothetical protein
MQPEIGRSYGLSSNLFVSRKASGDSLVVGGMAEDSSRFARVLSHRAAHMLWFSMARLLFPEKSDMVTALAVTAPLRHAGLPTITDHMEVSRTEPGNIDVFGWVNQQTWFLRLTDYEARRLWTALDIALYPSGWQGMGRG